MDKMNKLLNMSGVYIVTCTGNNKFYIGSTEKFENRYEQHRKDCRYASFKIKEMNDDVLKYGANSFKFDILCTCNYEVLTIVENHYIKLYNAKQNGYNKRFASNKLRNRRKYIYKPVTQFAREDWQINKLLDFYIINMCNLGNESKDVVVSLTQLIEIFELETGHHKEYLNEYFELIEKLDFNCYFKDSKEDIIYKVSGKQIKNLFNGGYFFKANVELKEGFRRHLGRGISLNYFFIEINELKNSYNIDFISNKNYINQYNIKDLRYNPYSIVNY